MINPITLDQAINTALQLPPDHQDMLIDILRKRRIESRRQKILEEANQSIAAFRAGQFEAQSEEDVIAELHLALENDE